MNKVIAWVSVVIVLIIIIAGIVIKQKPAAVQAPEQSLQPQSGSQVTLEECASNNNWGTMATTLKDCDGVLDPFKWSGCKAQVTHDAAPCTEVGDPDSRAMCEARAAGNVDACKKVKDTDQQSVCIAILTKTPESCGAIANDVLKSICYYNLDGKVAHIRDFCAGSD